MGRNDGGTKRMYIRELSNLIRQASKRIHNGIDVMKEDRIVEMKDGLAKIMMIILLRNRQRVLSQAWQYWVTNAGVHHDYTKDVRTILSRPTSHDEMRTELEIEVMYKWVKQNMEVDPTGLPHLLGMCKKKSAIVAALQHCRLETLRPGDGILYQGTLPKAEDGHFTILSGTCEVLQFSDTSLALLNLISCVKLKKWEVCHELLEKAELLTKLQERSGFGELATMANIKRTASVRASPSSETDVELLVVPRQQLIDCMQSRGSGDNAVISEAVDFFRHSGLANGISPSEIMVAAKNTIKRSLGQGEILFCKGEPVTSVYLVVSGEILLDTGDTNTDAKQAFLDSNADKCYYLSSKSIIGDEGLIGQGKTYESTAVVMSDMCVVFEAVGSCLHFLKHQLNAVRYCALAYKDQPVLSYPISSAERTNIYSNFDSLRRCIANANKTRGTLAKSSRPEPPPSLEEIAKHASAHFEESLAKRNAAMVKVVDSEQTNKDAAAESSMPAKDDGRSVVSKRRRRSKERNKYSSIPVSAIVGERRGSQGSVASRRGSRRGSSVSGVGTGEGGGRKMSATAYDALKSDTAHVEVVIPKNMQGHRMEEEVKLKIDNAKLPPEVRVRKASLQRGGADSENYSSTHVDQLRRTAATALSHETPSSLSALRARAASIVPTMTTTALPKRYVSATGLHRALEILKIAKHRAHEDGRKEARENIVIDQLLTLKKAEEKLGVSSEAEVMFEKSMQNHRLRMATILVDEQEDAKAWHLKDAQELHEFLASVMANNAAHGGASVDSDSGSDDDRDDEGKEGTADFDGGLTLAERRQQELHRSKLEMYFTGLRKKRAREKARLRQQLEELDLFQQRGRGSVLFNNNAPSRLRSSISSSSALGNFVPKMPPAASAASEAALSKSQPTPIQAPTSNKVLSLRDVQGGKLFDPHRLSTPLGQGVPWRPSSPVADNASSLGRTVEEEKRKIRIDSPGTTRVPSTKTNPTSGRGLSPLRPVDMGSPAAKIQKLPLAGGIVGGDDHHVNSVANALAAVQLNPLFASHSNSRSPPTTGHALPTTAPGMRHSDDSGSEHSDSGRRRGRRARSSGNSSPETVSYVPFMGTERLSQADHSPDKDGQRLARGASNRQASFKTDGGGAIRRSMMRLGSMRGSMMNMSMRSSLMRTISKGAELRRKPSIGNKTSLFAHIVPNFSRSTAPLIRRVLPNKNPYPSLDPAIQRSDAAAKDVVMSSANKGASSPVHGEAPSNSAIVPDIDDPRVFLEVLKAKDFSDRKKFKATHLWLTRFVKHTAEAPEDKDRTIVEKGSSWFQRLLQELDINVESDSEDDSRKNKSNNNKKNTVNEIVLERAVDRVPERNTATASSARSTATSAAASETVAPTDAAVAPGTGLSTSRSGVSATGTVATDTSARGPPSVSMAASDSGKAESNDANANTVNKQLGSRRSSVNDDASFKSTASLYSRASASSRRSASSLKNSSQASYTRSRRDSEESIYQEAQEISQSLNAKREQRESQQANRVTWVDGSATTATTLQPIQSVPVTADVSVAHTPSALSRVGSRPSSGTHTSSHDGSSHDGDALLKRGSMLLDGDDGDVGVHHQHTHHGENDHHQDHGHGHHHHHRHSHDHHSAMNVPAYRKPSEGIMKFKEVMSHEISSRKYLDGKRRCAKNSRFKLKGLEEIEEQEMMDDLDAPLPEDLALKNALIDSLFPRKAGEIPPHQTTKAPLTTRSDGERVGGAAKGVTSRDRTATAAAAASKLRAAGFAEGDSQLATWQEFSVSRSVDIKNGSHVTLPILGSYTRVHRQPGSNSGGLQVSRGLRVATGKEEFKKISGPSSYLEIAKKTNDSNPTKERRKV